MRQPVAKLLFVLMSYAMLYCREPANSTSGSSTTLNEAEIFLENSRPQPEVFKINVTKNAKITTKRGTSIRIPKGTFKGTGQIALKVTETLTPAEGAALKVPMRDSKGRTFQSDGMFRLDTDAKLIGKSQIRHSMIAKSAKPMNVYSWRDGKWVFEGKNQLVRSEDEDDDIRSFTGVEPNVLYNYDLPIEPQDESCVIIKLPTKQKKMSLLLFENDGRSTTSALASNSDQIGVSFARGSKVKLMIWTTNRQYWENANYRMPQRVGKVSEPESCETLTATFTEFRAAAELTLNDIKAKYGRIARIETKSGDIYVGYFNQTGANMSIMTTRGAVVIRVADVQKVTPMN